MTSTDLLPEIRRATDNAASMRFPTWMARGTWTEANAAGEPYVYWCTPDESPNKIILFLHSWGADYHQAESYPEFTTIDGACVVAPNFNGPNKTPSALYSEDAISRVMTVLSEFRYKTSLSRVYVVGYSGGGIMSLMLLGKYPGVFHRASIWLPGYDLASIYCETQNPTLQSDMVTVIGHAPTGPDDPDYLARSPRSVLSGFRGAGLTKVFLNVGSQDTQIPPHNGADAQAAMLAADPTANVQLLTWGIGHEFGSEQAINAVKQLILE